MLVQNTFQWYCCPRSTTKKVERSVLKTSSMGLRSEYRMFFNVANLPKRTSPQSTIRAMALKEQLMLRFQTKTQTML